MSASDFEITITPAEGAPYKFDLAEFALGGNDATVELKPLWGGDFSGRPQLAAEIADLLETLSPDAQRAKTIRTQLRVFFRFLDTRRITHSEDVSNSAEINDEHGIALLRWLGNADSAYRGIKSSLNRMRALQGSAQLFWPNRRPDVVNDTEVMDERALRAFARALRHEAKGVKATFAEGEQLAAAGRDPRLYRGKSAFLVQANRAWLIKHLTNDRIPDRKSLNALGTRHLALGSGPTYVPPGKSSDIGGISAALRWFFPTRCDAILFLGLFLIGTGWNLTTALALDVSSLERWYQPHPQDDRFAVVHAFKNRGSRHQFAISMKKPEWHPYRIIEFMIEKTEPLRRTAQERLRVLQTEHACRPSASLATEIHRYEQLVRSPWLFTSLINFGEVSGLIEGTSCSTHINASFREIIETHKLGGRYPDLVRFTLSQVRDSWIGHAYVQSGYNVLLTRLASQHRNISTLKHYLNARRYRAHSEEQVRKLQHAVFSEISDGRILDPTRLRLLVENGQITVEQEARLSDLRQRTRLGMGCLQPRSPPRAVAPDHKDGEICRVQRCTGCSNGVVFADSMPHLARAFAELRHIRRSIPLAAWETSSFAAETASIEQTLSSFDAQLVAEEIVAWTKKLEAGELKAYGTYPEY